MLVLDGFGVGEMPDADRFGDAGSNTLVNMARAVGGLNLPTLQRLGLGNIAPADGLTPAAEPLAWWGRMAEASPAKDTIVGHWELLGLAIDRPLPTYPRGFPPDVIARLEAAFGRGILGNKPASGTEIIKELGPEHLRTGKVIVYTSADSVLQIATHVDVVPVEQLYELCRRAREIMVGEHGVGRVIARPFAGEPGNFYRLPSRRDFSLPPPGTTAMDILHEAGIETVTVGKVGDILAHRSISREIHAAGNDEIMASVAQLAQTTAAPAFIIANLVDFDTLYGHRNDPQGYAEALARFDRWLAGFLNRLAPNDVLIITADHGCDPTTPSTDHSREYTPLLVYLPAQRRGRPLGLRRTFADVGATICDYFGCPAPPFGESFWHEINRETTA